MSTQIQPAEVKTLPQIVDDCKRCNLGFVVFSQGKRITFSFGELNHLLRMELEDLVDEFKPGKRVD